VFINYSLNTIDPDPVATAATVNEKRQHGPTTAKNWQSMLAKVLAELAKINIHYLLIYRHYFA